MGKEFGVLPGFVGDWLEGGILCACVCACLGAVGAFDQSPLHMY